MHRFLIAIAIAWVAIGAAACDNEDDNTDPPSEESTLAGYFGELEELQKEAQSRIDEIEPDIDADADASVEDGKDAFEDFFDELRAAFEGFVEDLEDLEPPDEAEALHADAVEASNDFLEALDESIEEIEELDSLAEIIGLDTPAFDEATERFDDVCVELQQLATDNDIDVDLSCD